MMKRIILCALCLMMVFSACLAEELPAKATCYKIKLNRNIPAETMREVFAEYMVPGCEVEYDEYRASCPDLINGGTGCFLPLRKGIRIHRPDEDPGHRGYAGYVRLYDGLPSVHLVR